MKKIFFALSMLTFAVSALPQARAADTSIDFFYNNLSGGNWIDVEGYGYGWQPDVATSDPNWRPYSDGYWAYTDYGWTWISYEDFGWATYHYGRWANLADYGWVWIPGEDLDWGPAWVSWRTGGDNIGWAPLPPRAPGVVYQGQPIGARVDVEYDIGPQYYNFCDVRFIGEPVLRDRIYPPTQNITYINNTVNVTNISVQNNVVYNYGPDYNVVNAYSARPIQRLTIERESAADLSTAARSGALTKVQGNRLLVAAPARIAKAPPNAKPPAVKAKVAQPKVERGWAGVTNKAELEQKIKTENPKNIPPPTHAAGRAIGSPVPGGARTPAAAGARTPVATPAGGQPGKPTPAVGSPIPGQRGKPTPGSPAAAGQLGKPTPAAASPAGGQLGKPTPAAGSPSAAGQRGKPTPAGRPRPGATAMPGQAGGISPSPFERGKGRPGITPAAPPARLSPSPLDRSPRGAKPGEGTGAARPTPPNFRPSPPAAEQGRPPARTLGQTPKPGGGAGNVPPGRERPIERQKFGTPPPVSTSARDPRSMEPRPAPGARQPVTTPPAAGAPAQARGAQGPGGAHAQPPGAPKAAPPPAGERAPAQPQGGGKKPAKPTPPPGPQ
ncbi:MAG TPA: DUF6600 domain-containing protein [Candidatus Udaeobacter sp.]|nr:DUF6600 domain-containing protein [Candidatus Udaeobacter sp.]